MWHATCSPLLGIAAFSGVVFFQLVNLPVEFNASSRAKEQLTALGIVRREQQEHVNISYRMCMR